MEQTLTKFKRSKQLWGDQTVAGGVDVRAAGSYEIAEPVAPPQWD